MDLLVKCFGWSPMFEELTRCFNNFLFWILSEFPIMGEPTDNF